MSNMSDSQFFAIQRLEGVLEDFKKRRVSNSTQYIDKATKYLRVCLKELPGPTIEEEEAFAQNVQTLGEVAEELSNVCKETSDYLDENPLNTVGNRSTLH